MVHTTPGLIVISESKATCLPLNSYERNKLLSLCFCYSTLAITNTYGVWETGDPTQDREQWNPQDDSEGRSQEESCALTWTANSPDWSSEMPHVESSTVVFFFFSFNLR